MKLQHNRAKLLLLLTTLATTFIMASAAWANVGIVKINGNTIPEIHFEAFRLNYLPDQYKCSYEAVRNGTIDYHVMNLIAQPMRFRISKNNQRYKDSLAKKIQKLPVDDNIERAKLELKLMVYQRPNLMKLFGHEISKEDIETEHKHRVAMRDPYLFDIPVYKIQKIGPFRNDDLLVEAANLINSGMPFEQVAEKFPPERRPRPLGPKIDKNKLWHTSDAIIRHGVDTTDLVPGYVMGLAELLKDNDAWVGTLVKIIDTKVIPQVTNDDLVVFSNKSDSPYYVSNYMRNHVKDWKHAQFMDSLWSDFEITENGLPIKRFHSYADCKPLF